jgi:hypothetical protein
MKVTGLSDEQNNSQPCNGWQPCSVPDNNLRLSGGIPTGVHDYG